MSKMSLFFKNNGHTTHALKNLLSQNDDSAFPQITYNRIEAEEEFMSPNKFVCPNIKTPISKIDESSTDYISLNTESTQKNNSRLQNFAMRSSFELFNRRAQPLKRKLENTWFFSKKTKLTEEKKRENYKFLNELSQDNQTMENLSENEDSPAKDESKNLTEKNENFIGFTLFESSLKNECSAGINFSNSRYFMTPSQNILRSCKNI